MQNNKKIKEKIGNLSNIWTGNLSNIWTHSRGGFNPSLLFFQIDQGKDTRWKSEFGQDCKTLRYSQNIPCKHLQKYKVLSDRWLLFLIKSGRILERRFHHKNDPKKYS